jgi:hypothetical protein
MSYDFALSRVYGVPDGYLMGNGEDAYGYGNPNYPWYESGVSGTNTGDGYNGLFTTVYTTDTTPYRVTLKASTTYSFECTQDVMLAFSPYAGGYDAGDNDYKLKANTEKYFTTNSTYIYLSYVMPTGGTSGTLRILKWNPVVGF